MPAIFLGGSDWAYSRQWPEGRAAEPWQWQLRTIMRGYLPCRQIVMRCGADADMNAMVDWTHPGVGQSKAPNWERMSVRGATSATGTFDIGPHAVAFYASAGSNRRAGSGAAANTAAVVSVGATADALASESFTVTLETPTRVSLENAALLSMMCLAVARVIGDIAAGVMSSAQRAGASAGPSAAASSGRASADNPELSTVLSGLETFPAKVLELICSGWTNAEIAASTRMSLSSVRAATSAIYARLGVRNRHEAAALCGAHFAQAASRR